VALNEATDSRQRHDRSTADSWSIQRHQAGRPRLVDGLPAVICTTRPCSHCRCATRNLINETGRSTRLRPTSAAGPPLPVRSPRRSKLGHRLPSDGDVITCHDLPTFVPKSKTSVRICRLAHQEAPNALVRTVPVWRIDQFSSRTDQFRRRSGSSGPNAYVAFFLAFHHLCVSPLSLLAWSATRLAPRP
jgi:hypothetical protein